ncbi:unnamed protein product [Amoebophrya sp. A25]|nr:unnamed protein product [Amoebophrya sp. A25]|eukprot:GSA25T00014157001.1
MGGLSETHTSESSDRKQSRTSFYGARAAFWPRHLHHLKYIYKDHNKQCIEITQTMFTVYFYFWRTTKDVLASFRHHRRGLHN